MFRNVKARFPLSALGALLALMVAACGGGSTDIDDTQSAAYTAMSGSAQTAKLSMEPINLSEAEAPLSGAPKTIPVCPWLSDASANAAVVNVMTSELMARRTVTQNECKWNVNMGFALRIHAVPLAKALNPGTVKYNMDVPPVLEPQNGPGGDAVVILDPTWDANKPRPFAFVFTADNRQFTITTTGVKTSVDQLRAVADEIAHALPTAAPIA